ncbi:group 1 glycosyl transferase [Flavobacterium cyanobacteriorum]|uniref:Group 1 glycosyl transferase n=1 Tax=Flavobacterium cyanobacteriorum TaxID=2022802 RepID=A0A255YZJ3_9FLAO|nr:glycosyltransferase [Flavobacterium cyanobacteriorum]OYQ34667.1 group 1 glycosyl transferase [Flavobacterium cyanobacteriorum]
MYNKIKFYLRLRLLQNQLKKKQRVIDYSIMDATKKSILIIDYIIPEFDKDSGSRRITEIIKLLLKNGYSVFLLPDYKEYRYNNTYVYYFRELGVTVYEPAVDSKGNLVTREDFIKAIAKNISFAWLHRPDIFNKYYPVVKRLNPKIRVIFDMVDFHYLRLKREAEVNNDKKVDEKAEKQLALELDNCRKADRIIVISEKDKEALLAFYKDAEKMKVISNVHDFAAISSKGKTFRERRGLLFVGGFRHKPNEDAAVYLCKEILPRVWEQHPEIKLTIVGSNPTDVVKSLQSDRISVTGYVEDIVPYFGEARLFVAPLRFGAGIKGKIGQSLENSLPLITTSIGAEGFDLGDFEREIVADTAHDFAQKIINLYFNQKLWEEISDYSSKVIEPFSIAAAEQNVIDTLKD